LSSFLYVGEQPGDCPVYEEDNASLYRTVCYLDSKVIGSATGKAPIKMTGAFKDEAEESSGRELNMNRVIAVALLLLFETGVFGQQPERRIIPIDFSLYAGVILTRTMDYISTENVLAAGGRELLLPKFLVIDRPMFAAFSFGSGMAEIYASRELRRTHPKMARYILIGDIVAAGVVAVHNEASVPSKMK
jgi:hypothetical protein